MIFKVISYLLLQHSHLKTGSTRIISCEICNLGEVNLANVLNLFGKKRFGKKRFGKKPT